MIKDKKNSSKKKGFWLEEKARKGLEKIFSDDFYRVNKKEISVKTNWEGVRKIDALVEEKFSEKNILLMECKDKKSINVGDVDQAIEQARDIQARNIAILGNGKFSKNALKKSRFYGVYNLNYIDTSDARVRTIIKFPLLSSFIWLKSFKYSCRLFDKDIDKICSPPEDVLLSKDKSVLDLAKKLWNEGVFVQEKGKYVYEYTNFNMAEALSSGVKLVPVDSIVFEYEVVKKDFISFHSLFEGVGFYNVSKSEFIPLSEDIRFGPINIEEIIKEENEVKNEVLIETSFSQTLIHIL